jgi:hypothetical protein
MLRRDIWRLGLVHAPIQAVVAAGGLEAVPVEWLPPAKPPLSFLADPFGISRDGTLNLFAEAYDYRTRRGTIVVQRYDPALRLIGQQTVLSEPWHLSYPFVFEAEGETWMLPEAHRSGTLSLYRSSAFPYSWEKVASFGLDTPAIDATPFQWDGRWWLAYAPGGSRAAKQSHLHLAFADRLTGPWTPHPANPVRIDFASSRPGGSPFTDKDGGLVLPVQDCTNTYGGAVRPLRILELSPAAFRAEAGAEILPPSQAAPFLDGLHTLSACGDLTLVDVKRVDRSLSGFAATIAWRLGGGRR